MRVLSWSALFEVKSWTDGAYMTEIYVDADACPVKQEVLRVAERHGLKVWFVGNQGLREGLHRLAEMVIVPDTFDAADDWIADHVTGSDIAITADIPLASRCLENGAIAHPVQGVTAASSSLDMLKNVQMVGNDLRFNASVNSPTLLISEMTISGKGAQGS